MFFSTAASMLDLLAVVGLSAASFLLSSSVVFNWQSPSHVYHDPSPGKVKKQTNRQKMLQAGGFQDGCRDIRSTHDLMVHFDSVNSTLRFDVHRLIHTVC